MTFFPATTSHFDAVAWWATCDGNRSALIEAATGQRHTYAQLNDDAQRWGAMLLQHGVAPGDRVALLSANRVEFVAAYFGCLRVGATIVPLNWRLAAPELARVLGDCQPALVVGTENFRALAEESLRLTSPSSSARWLDLDHDVPRALAQADRTFTSALICGDDTAMLLYTSGSTGTPKGVIIPHRQVLWNSIATTTSWQLGADDVGPATTPFFHTGGWNVFTLPILFRGGAVLLVNNFEPASFLDMLREHNVTVSFGVPTHLAMLRAHSTWGTPLPKLRWFISGGAPCPQNLRDAVRSAGYRFREGYGLTECGPNCFATNNETAVNRAGTVGWPVAHLNMRLTDSDGRIVPHDQVGELELRGPQMFGGYYRSPEQTGAVLTNDGWLRTGDLASRDIDGVYSIRGRRKEMFISGGENVFPGEVEAALLDCAGVAEACVVGVADAQWGEVGCAIIVKSRDDATNTDALLAAVRSRVAGYKVPKRVLFVDAIPRLGSGKVDRRALLQLVDAS